MRRLLPALTLILLAPLIAEVLPGSAPLSHPGFLPFILFIYGPAALLIHEVVRRTGRGWPAILLLGAAYGLIEEGIALQSLFNPDLYHAADWGGRVFGINGVYAEAAITIHAVWTAAIPILVADLLFPDRRNKPYLGRAGLVVTTVWYLLGVALLGLITRFSIAPNFWAPPAVLGATAALAVAVAIVAFLIPTTTNAIPFAVPHPAKVLAFIATAGPPALPAGDSLENPTEVRNMAPGADPNGHGAAPARSRTLDHQPLGKTGMGHRHGSNPGTHPDRSNNPSPHPPRPDRDRNSGCGNLVDADLPVNKPATSAQPAPGKALHAIGFVS